MDESTLWESYCSYLQTRGWDVQSSRSNEKRLIHEPSEETREVLVEAMKNDPEAELLTELFVDYDEGLQVWRYRHVKMVERTIGTKKGTGGADGAKYLHKTLNHPIFPDLWAIRSRF